MCTLANQQPGFLRHSKCKQTLVSKEAVIRGEYFFIISHVTHDDGEYHIYSTLVYGKLTWAAAAHRITKGINLIPVQRNGNVVCFLNHIARTFHIFSECPSIGIFTDRRHEIPYVWPNVAMS